MITINQVSSLLDGGGEVVGADGHGLGRIGQVYLDDATGDPAWVTVRTGLFGTSETFVPLYEATAAGSDIAVPYDRQQVHDAPRVDADGSISPQEEIELYSYYGVRGYGDDVQEGTGTTARHAAGTSEVTDDVHSATGRATDEAMTRSEEVLRVGTVVREAGRARLRKYVVTQEQTATVQVRREELRIEREPISDAAGAGAQGEPVISEEDYEVVLHEEVPVVSREVHPVERVRVATQVVQADQHITAELRKEQVVLEQAGVDQPGVDQVGLTQDAPVEGAVPPARD